MSTKVELAKALAFHYHRGQKYGIFPYSKHLEDVALNCRTLCGNDEDVLCVAYLHDILEDTTIDREIILDLFGAHIHAGVFILTKIKDVNYDEYIRSIKMDTLAHKVKYCDTLANLRQSIEDGNVKRITKYTKQLDLLGDYLNA